MSNNNNNNNTNTNPEINNSSTGTLLPGDTNQYVYTSGTTAPTRVPATETELKEACLTPISRWENNVYDGVPAKRMKLNSGKYVYRQSLAAALQQTSSIINLTDDIGTIPKYGQPVYGALNITKLGGITNPILNTNEPALIYISNGLKNTPSLSARVYSTLAKVAKTTAATGIKKLNVASAHLNLTPEANYAGLISILQYQQKTLTKHLESSNADEKTQLAVYKQFSTDVLESIQELLDADPSTHYNTLISLIHNLDKSKDWKTGGTTTVSVLRASKAPVTTTEFILIPQCRRMMNNKSKGCGIHKNSSICYVRQPRRRTSFNNNPRYYNNSGYSGGSYPINNTNINAKQTKQ